MTEDAEKVVAVEYHAGHPHSVVTATKSGRGWSVWDFDWCKRDQTVYYHQSGGSPAEAYSVGKMVGGTTDLWVDPSITTFKNYSGKPLTRRQVEKYGYRFLPKLKEDPFDNAVSGAVTWCMVCKDHLPDDNSCNHLVWTLGEGMLGCGTGEHEHETHLESLEKFFQVLGRDLVARLLNCLVTDGKGWECWCPGGEADQLHLRDPVTHEDVGLDLDSEKAEAAGVEWDDLFVGMAWLSSLEPGKTKKAVRLTIRWMRAWLSKGPDRG